MARHHAHFAVIAAGPIAEDSRQTAHRPCACVPNVLGGVNMPEEHEPGWDPGNPLSEGRAADEFHLVVVVVGCVEDTVGWTVGDEDVETLRNVVPDPIDCPTILHVRPVTVAWCEWASPDPEALNGCLLIDEETDSKTLDGRASDEALLKGRVVVARDKDFRRDRQRGEPVDECPKFRLVAVWVLPVGSVPAVDDGIDATGDDELVMVHVSVGDVENFHFDSSIASMWVIKWLQSPLR